MENTKINLIKLTTEYLYKKGVESYQYGLQMSDANSKKQEKFTDAILYFEGAMILGSEDACAYLSEFLAARIILGLAMNT